MRNQRNVSLDNTPVVISSPHSVWLCHEGTGTTLTDSGTAGNQIIGDIAVNGTTAGIWATGGNFTPAGDHTEQHADAAQLAFGDLSDATQGVAQLLFFCDFYATAKPSTNFNTLLMYGLSSGPDLHRFTIETTGRFQVQTKDSASATVSANTGTYGDVCDSTRHALVAFIDFVGGTQTCYVDGVLQGSSALDTASPVASSSRGWGTLSNITSAAPAFNTELGSEGMTGCYISRMGLIRPSANIAGSVGDIAQGLYDLQHELPRVLHGI